MGKCISTLDIAVDAINAANAAIRDAVILPDAAGRHSNKSYSH